MRIMTKTEKSFENAMREAYDHIKKACGYRPNRFMQMVGNIGAVAAAKQVIGKPDGSEGFSILWAHKCLKFSVEAHVIKAEYQTLFTDEERKICEERLKQHNYDFDAL